MISYNLRHIIKNIGMSLGVQIVSMAVSLLLSLIVPKYISLLDYSYWQMFVLWSGYVGLFHFGLLDGIVLRYSQYDYEDLPKPLLRSQWKIFFYFLSFLSIVTIYLSQALDLSQALSRVYLFFGLSLLLKNCYTYNIFVLQATNRISFYAKIVISQRLGQGGFVFFLLLIGVGSFEWYCVSELVGDAIACLLSLQYNKGLYWGPTVSKRQAYQDFIENISAGVKLMIANLSSLFIIGGAKLFVQFRWNPLEFGSISFAFSMANIFLVFVSAISIVLFPALKRMEENSVKRVYPKIEKVTTVTMLGALLLYFPVYYMISWWLPKYTDSLFYLGLIFPMTLFSAKISLLTNNYLKVFRRESLMLIINIVSLIFSLLLYAFFTFANKDLTMLVISVLLVVAFRSFLSEIAVNKEIMNGSFYVTGPLELIVSAAFVLCSILDNKVVGAISYSVIIAFVLVVNRKDILNFITVFKNK